jgi:T5SS/PEP-CTERM-associated repeat protein
MRSKGESRTVSESVWSGRSAALIACAVTALSFFLTIQSALAQFTANFQTQTISGVTSNWLDTFYIVGSNTFADTLQITASGVLSNGSGVLGYATGGSNNAAIVNGTGSTWKNATNLYVGFLGTGNELILTNGGRVFDQAGTMGFSNANGNAALVTGSGSMWSNAVFLYVGYNGADNEVVVSNGGTLWAGDSYLADGTLSSNNQVSVIGTGSVWATTNAVYVGFNGSSNTVAISGGGVANDLSVYLGYSETSSSNTMVVSGAGSVLSNAFNTFLGLDGPDNQLTVSNGAYAFDESGVIGFTNSSFGNVALVSDPGSVWSNTAALYVGYEGSFNQLIVSNGARVFGATNYVAWFSVSSNNIVSVVGTGSVWSSTNFIYIGYVGSSNMLIVANGGRTATIETRIGYDPLSTNNVALITGSGSVMSNTLNTVVGYGGNASQLIVSNGATVYDSVGFLAYTNQSAQDTATVTGIRSEWVNTNELCVGNLGALNQLFVVNGGFVYDDSIYLGVGPASSNNTVVLSGDGSMVSNTFNTFLGFRGSGNVLIISNGAGVFDQTSSIGYTNASSYNTAWVVGAGSVWTNTLFSAVGYNGSFNQLIVSNGGSVWSGNGYLALITTGSSNNTATITGSGSVWSTTNGIYVGYVGSSNQLLVLDGGAAYALSSFAGTFSTSSNNTIVVSGTGSVMSNTFNTYIGNGGPGNLLVISNGGTVFDEYGILADTASGDDNTALIDGTGSVWSNTQYVYVGLYGGTNQMRVTNGGAVIDGTGVIGYSNASPDNVVIINGAGSTWTTITNLFMGYMGANNQLIVSNGGTVFSSNSYVGTYLPSSNNTVIVTGAGSQWINTNVLFFGYEGARNSLIIEDGGAVIDSNGAVIGYFAGANSNSVLITGPGSDWSNAYSAVVLSSAGGFGNSLTISNGGAVFGGLSTGGTNSSVSVIGPGSTLTNGNISGTYIGDLGFSNVLTVTAGGIVYSGLGYVAYNYGTNNLAVVSGPGSLWYNTLDFEVGAGGFGNRLVVSNGGVVFGGTNGCYLGDGTFWPASSNSALVSGTGSIWSNESAFYVGQYSYGNALAISNGGVLFDTNGWLGYVLGFGGTAGSNNTATVTGSGSVWNNAGPLTIGQGGPSNQLFVTAGGRVIATTVTLGPNGNNLLHLSNGVVQAAVTNGAGNLLTGSGTITGSTVNFGTISANVNGATLTFANGLSNRGFVGNSGGGIIEVYGIFFNAGTTGFTNGGAVFHGPTLSDQGTTNSWNVTSSGPWEQAADWSLGVTPSPTNAAILITNAVSKTVTVSSNTFASAPGSVTNFGLTVSGPSGSTNTLLIENTPAGSPFTMINVYVSTNAAAIITNAAVQIGLLNVGTFDIDGTVQVGPGAVLDASNVGTMNIGYAAIDGLFFVNGGTALSGYTVMAGTGIVSGASSVWSNSTLLDYGMLIVTNGGTVVGGGQIQTVAIVTGTGSVWNALQMAAGYDEAIGAQLIITNGGTVYSAIGDIDLISGESNQVTVSGGGATWNLVSSQYTNIQNEGQIYIGAAAYGGDELNIGPGGSVLATYIFLGEGSAAPCYVNMTGGSLMLESNQFEWGEMDVYNGALVLDGGTVTLANLVLEPSIGSLTNLGVVAFSAGTLYSANTQATNGMPFVVGDGTDAANFVLQGGVHLFTSLEISNAAVLSGCGTVTGPVQVDPGGTILSDCGTLTFTGIVTNNGIMHAENGSVIESYGPVINNGVIDIMDGSTNFHSGFVNHGTVVDASYFRVTGITNQTGSVNLAWTTVGGRSYVVQTNAPPPNGSYTNNFSDFTSTVAVPGQSLGTTNYLDLGGATNTPSRYYRVRLVP